MVSTSSTTEREATGAPPPLAPRELARWGWRQLTSMRTALLLLLLLALGSVPGSVVPQQNIDASRVLRWKADHPGLTPLYEKLGLFSVYDSVWFSAIYLLLMLSLVGCIVPRLGVYARAVRARPPAAPRRLDRLPAHATALTSRSGAEVLERAGEVLRRRRYRVVASGDAVSAERGYLREAGNLLFHVSVIAVLVCFAAGQLWGFKGGVIVPVGRGFTNLVSQYDTFDSGTLMDPEQLPPLHFTVDDFTVKFIPSGTHRGQPESFAAHLTYTEAPGEPERTQRIEVNHPLVLDGVSVFLVGHGYAPVVTVTDGRGKEVYSGPTVFLPQDASFASYGVVKAPEAQPKQIGLDGFFLPTFAATKQRGVFSAFPDALNPGLSLRAYAGNLGLDDGLPQSVYDLDTRRMKPVLGKDGTPLQIVLSPGRAVKLPDGLGTVRFDGWQRWVKLQVSDAPAKTPTLVSITIGLLGLMGSLFIRRRRAWVRVLDTPEGTRVEVAGLDRSTVSQTLDDEVHTLLGLVVPETAGDTDRTDAPPEETA
ncbi:cytochrome c biogenesis protein ResB [Nocardioides marmoribigeumensis]|uniref:Cytochrome c biogenesis protein n=1 Tax=Nocardioides marmoribigeumensis TaxID=433649 RepID=A0ABU2BTU0_9ACTN|nr:cytochrome c biogenesis protein ResB [Nocardioides marmoribigeumensis]MDR7361706.1 cytochrome c biogenesis protein [Nocardioides marmoribigeumensis]